MNLSGGRAFTLSASHKELMGLLKQRWYFFKEGEVRGDKLFFHLPARPKCNSSSYNVCGRSNLHSHHVSNFWMSHVPSQGVCTECTLWAVSSKIIQAGSAPSECGRLQILHVHLIVLAWLCCWCCRSGYSVCGSSVSESCTKIDSIVIL